MRCTERLTGEDKMRNFILSTENADTSLSDHIERLLHTNSWLRVGLNLFVIVLENI